MNRRISAFRHELTAAILWTLIVWCGSAQATDYFWNVTSGDYATGTNWNPAGPPSPTDDAYINNGGTATLASGSGDAHKMELASTAGSSGTFNVSGGDLLVGDRVRIGEIGTGTATVSGGSIIAPIGEQDIFVGGENGPGTGTLTISGASTTVQAYDDFILGRTGTGTMNFQSGWAAGGYTVVGKFGTGTWNQSGGVYEQTFGDIEIGDGGRPDQSSTPGPRFGTINITGGVFQGAGHLAIGNRVGGGTVNVSGGALALTGSVGDGSIIIGRGMDWAGQPGSGGNTTFRVIGGNSRIVANGALSMNPDNVQASSTLVAQITGTSLTTIRVAGNANIGNGDFKVELQGYAPVLGNTWTLIEAGADLTADKAAISALADSLTSSPFYDGLQHADPAALGTVVGTFKHEDFSLAPLSAGLAWDVVYSTNNVQLKVIAAAGVTGDYNNNGKVDAADYVVWRNNVGTSTALPNDPLGGTIGSGQYNQWRSHFGQPPGVGSGAVAVPEPATSMALLWVGIAACCARLVHRPSSIRRGQLAEICGCLVSS